MKIEEVEALEQKIICSSGTVEGFTVCLDALKQAIEVLRAEAWYPIEKAEEMGVKDWGRVVLQEDCDWFPGYRSPDGFWRDTTGAQCFPSHFKRITPPGN